MAANASGTLPPSADDRTPDLAQGFEQSANGFTVTNEAADGSTQVWSLSGAQAYGGQRSLGLAANLDVAAASVNAGSLHTWLSNVQAIDLRTAQQARITFYLNLNVAPTASFFVGVSTDNQNFNGARWSGSSGGWQQITLDLSAYLGQPEVYVAWVFEGALDGDEGIWIDDVVVWTYLNTPPAQVTSPLLNGDFEIGDSRNWQTNGGVIVSAPNPTNGQFVLQLGGHTNTVDSLEQRLVIPNDAAAQASFDFWLNLFGEEDTPNVDMLCVGLYGETNGQRDANNLLLDLGCVDGITAYTSTFGLDGWEQVDYPLMSQEWSAVRGQTIYAYFELRNNATLPTTVYLDDIAVNVVRGGEPGDPTEPNDMPSEAISVTQAITLTNMSIDHDYDADYYHFTAAAGDTAIVNIDAATRGSPLDAIVQIVDSNQNEVCTNDDDTFSSDPYLVCPVANAGDYYAVVRSYDSNGGRDDTYDINIHIAPHGAPLPPVPTPASTPNLPPAPANTWTAMLYMDGDTNLCGVYPELIKRIEEELGDKIGPDGFLDVVVLLDRIPSFCNGDGSTVRFHAQVHSRYTESIDRWNMGELNMGDPQTLIDFANWAMRNYPAAHYYLAIDDHGGGVSGLSWDESNLDVDNKSDKLTNAELYVALKAITRNGAKKLDLLAYEACLMGLFENAYDARRYADYLFFFPTVNFTNSASYPSYFKDPRFQASSTGRQLGDIMFDVYFQTVNRKAYAMSLVDTTKIDPLQSALNAWAVALIQALPAKQAEIALTRTLAQKVDSNNDGRISDEDQFVDLWDLADKLAAQGIAASQGAALKAAIQAAVVRADHRSSGRLFYDQTHGLTIYWPQTASGWYRAYVNHNIYSLTRDGQWDEFLRAYFGDSNRPGLTNDAGPVNRQANDRSIYLPVVLVSN
ncbi:MAG: clostripain-related cysteine peptidase [Caldilineaceae bacterium]